MTKQPDASPRFDLVLERIIKAPKEKVYEAWTNPELLRQWFAPKPWTVSDINIDVRPGGSQYFVLNGPNGEAFPNRGVYLEVIPNEKIVTTDAYVRAWEPSEKPFMTAIMTFEDAGDGKTRYRAVARHWSAEDREEHEKMGFHEGWGQCADQLAELVSKKS